VSNSLIASLRSRRYSSRPLAVRPWNNDAPSCRGSASRAAVDGASGRPEVPASSSETTLFLLRWLRGRPVPTARLGRCHEIEGRSLAAALYWHCLPVSATTDRQHLHAGRSDPIADGNHVTTPRMHRPIPTRYAEVRWCSGIDKNPTCSGRREPMRDNAEFDGPSRNITKSREVAEN
jgi:hypothetical protein